MNFSSIRTKLFISLALLALLVLASSFYLVYGSTKQALRTTINNQLEDSTTLITNLVRSVASTSVENHLKTIAETQLEVVSGIYAEYLNGHYSETEAKQLASRLLLRQDIGTSGYLYCINSYGNVTVHRDKQVEHSNVLDFEFVRAQVRMKSGYLEYRWKNPGEPAPRDKALYMSYFQPWDWIISASAYKSEFAHLIDIGNINKALRQIGSGQSGYPFIVAGNGDYIYHPALVGNLYSSGLSQEQVKVVEGIIKQQQGSIYYTWKNPQENRSRDKIALLQYLPEYDWVVGSSAYLEELYLPLVKIQQLFLAIFLAYVLLVLAASYALSRRITKPIELLSSHLQKQAVTDLQPITARFSHDEIGTLASYLNRFITALNQRHQSLESEIIERKRSEKALRESEQTFHTLFDHSFQFIALLGPEGRVCKINRTALAFRNLHEEDILGEYFWDTPWWKHSEVLVGQLKDAYSMAQNGQVARFEAYSSQVRDIYLDVSLKPVLDDDKRVIYIVAEARDITEVKRAELELQQAQKMESVGILAGGIAHDFNNILGGILGTLSLLKLKRDKGLPLPEEKLYQHLDNVNDTALRAKGIVNQLLTLSRKRDLQFTPVNLQQILQNVCRIAANTFDKSIRIETDIATILPVRADSNSLEQVFLNLCINAAHAMTIMRPADEPWGGTLTVSQQLVTETGMAGRKAGDYWRVSIADTGVGIDEETRKQLFVPFFTTKGKEVGTGLGLAMVYHIVEQHHGYIELESSPGKGSCFHLSLPVCKDPLPELSIDQDSKPILGEGLILIVDDEELIRNNAAEILQFCGYQVLTAENGREGVEMFRQQSAQIDAVLLDLVMPEMSGKETYAALKQIDAEVKVLLSSGFRRDSRVDEILAAGANCFIQKPYSLTDLSQAVKSLLEEK